MYWSYCYLDSVVWTAVVEYDIVHTGVKPKYLKWTLNNYLNMSSISHKEVDCYRSSLLIFQMKLDLFYLSDAWCTLWKLKGLFSRGHRDENAIIQTVIMAENKENILPWGKKFPTLSCIQAYLETFLFISFADQRKSL